MPLIVNGGKIDVPGLHITDFTDAPSLRLKMGEDKRLRGTRWVRQIGLHTTKGEWPQTIKPGLGPFKDVGEKVANFWCTSKKKAGAHLVVDWDGTITCHCDLVTEASMHGGIMNEYSVGVEIFQGPGPEFALYEGQLDVVVLLMDALTSLLGVQRQILPPDDYKVVYPRFTSTDSLKHVVGILGHRHVTTDRGRGDPGDHIFLKLKDAGYDVFDFRRGQDVKVWKDRQRNALGAPLLSVDGEPGPHTLDLLIEKGYDHGLWVSRP